MADPFSIHAPDPYAVLGRRVLDAIHALAPGEGELPSEADYAALSALFADAPPARILDVGGGAGATAMLLALAYPNARLIAIDPDRRIEAAAPAGQSSPISSLPISWTALSLAQAAAQRLGVATHIRFAPGAFAASPRGEPTRLRPVGPDICASEPDFDLIVLDGSPDAEARAADLRLAASALAPSGVIAVRRTIGADAALVRAGVYEFLRYNPAFHFMHAPLAEARGTFGFLRHRSADWFPGQDAPHPVRAEDVAADVRDGLANQVGLMLGARPVLEVAVGAPVLGSAVAGSGGARALHLTTAELSARFVDPVIDQIFAALDHAPGSALFSGDLLDFASDELVTRLFARLADHGAPAVFAITPPGEAGVAGPASRPAARVIDFAVGQGLGVYGSAGLEFEAARHAGGNGDAAAASDSRYLSLLMFAPKAPWRDAGGRSLVDVSPVAAAQHEQVELQRIQTHAALKARIAEHHEARSEAERTSADLSERLSAAKLAAGVARQSHERTLRTNEAAMAQLRGELHEQTELGRTLHADLEEARTEAAHERERLQQAETDFAARLRAAEAALFDHRDRFQRDLSDIGERLDQANQRVALADATIAELRAELDTRNAAIADSRTRIASLTSERANLEGQLRALMESMDQARGQLETLTAEATRTRTERDGLQSEATLAQGRIAELTGERDTLRNTHAALGVERDGLERQLAQTRNRIDELTALRAVKTAEAERLTQHLNAANSRLLTLQAERDDAGRNAEAALSGLHERLEAANAQVVASALREMDARLRLEGIDAHLALSQQAIDLYRADPAAFRADALPYPKEPDDAPADDTADANLIALAKALHGRAADVSRELADTLEAAGSQDPLSEVAEARLHAKETSHREAMEKLRVEFADRLGAADRVAAEKTELDAGADAFDALIARIETLLGAPPADAAPAAESRPAAQRRRLEHILHVMDANIASRQAPAAVEPPRPARPAMSPAPQPAVTKSFGVAPRPVPVPAEPRQPPTLAATRKDNWADRNASVWAASPDAHPPRTLLQRADHWMKAYPETYRLTRIQRDLRHRFAPLGLKPRIFDADYYLSQGPIAPHTNALRHYLLVGENEGRRPIPGFDPTYYRTHFRNPPAGADSLLGHFLSHGAEQGLSPSAEFASLWSDAQKAAVNPLEYFFRWSQTPERATATTVAGN
jgi:hypothetical protein